MPDWQFGESPQAVMDLRNPRATYKLPSGSRRVFQNNHDVFIYDLADDDY
jgi:hypothetical protein